MVNGTRKIRLTLRLLVAAWVAAVLITAALIAEEALAAAPSIPTAGNGATIACTAAVPHGRRGWYWADTREILIGSEECARILHLQGSAPLPRAELVRWQLYRAVLVLAHELGHAAGIVNEVQADCFGIARWRRVAANFLRVPAWKLRPLLVYNVAPSECLQKGS